MGITDYLFSNLVSLLREYEPENIKSVFVLVLWLIGVIASTVFTILCWKYKVESSKQYSETIKKQGDIICNLMERKNNSNN